MRWVIPTPAIRGLGDRYRARAAAEAELVAYLAGLADALDIARERIEGFDDTTGELILTDPPPEED
jgi:hypothetical protein